MRCPRSRNGASTPGAGYNRLLTSTLALVAVCRPISVKVACLYTQVASEIEATISNVAFYLPGSQDWVEIRGQIAWVSESRLEAGIRFLDPAETVRSRLKELI